MSQKNNTFSDRIPFFYRFRSKVHVYLANLRVRYSFGGKIFVDPVFLLGSVLGISASFFVLAWFMSRQSTSEVVQPPPLPPTSRVEAPVIPPAKAERTLSPVEEEKPPSAPPPSRKEEAPPEPAPIAEIKKEESVPRIMEPEVKEEVAKVPPPPVEQKPAVYMKTKADLVNLRTHAYLESDVVARLSADYMVRVLEIRGDWVKTDTGEGIEGWIYKDLLEGVSSEEYTTWSRSVHRPSARQVLRRDLDDPAVFAEESRKIKELVLSWKAAWESKDIERYMGFYSKSFTTSKYNWETYKEYKGNVFRAASSIVVEISDVQVKWENYAMVASFIQDYRSSTLSSKRGKSLSFHQEGNDWKIIREGVVGEQGG